jgi:predicted ATPase
MGRFLARMAAAGVQVIVETHSDHCLNGVRLALRDGAFSADSLVVHFFGRPAAADAHVKSPAIDAKGNLSEWPQGFFDQFENDLARLAGWDQ